MSHGLASLFNIVANQGSSFSRTILWKDPAKKAINLNGYTGRMQVRLDTSNSDVVLELTTENGGILFDVAAGEITLKASSATMESIPSDKYVYDLELVAPVTGVVYKIMYGNFVVRSEVTR